jgi:hypothetical protein
VSAFHLLVRSGMEGTSPPEDAVPKIATLLWLWKVSCNSWINAKRQPLRTARQLAGMIGSTAEDFSALKIQTSPPMAPTIKLTAPNRMETTVPSMRASPA